MERRRTSATDVALVSLARCTAVTLEKVAWSGEQVSRQKKCLKLRLHAGQPTRKMLDKLRPVRVQPEKAMSSWNMYEACMKHVWHVFGRTLAS